MFIREHIPYMKKVICVIIQFSRQQRQRCF